MHNNSRSVAFVLLNILFYSVFPVLSFGAHLHANPTSVLFFSQIGGLLVALPFVRRSKIVEQAVIIKNSAGLFFTTSVASVFTGYFFLRSLDAGDGITSTIVLEAWPVFAMLFAAIFVKNAWKTIRPYHIALVGVALTGVVVLALANHFNSTHSNPNAIKISSVPSVLFALLAALSSGFTVVQSEISRRLSAIPDFSTAALVIVFARGLGVLVTGAILLVSGDPWFDRTSFGIGMLMGFTVYGLASIFAIQAIRFADNLLNILLWFFSPVVGVFWLAVFHQLPISDLHLIALTPILVANIFAGLGSTRRISFFALAVISATLAAATYAFDGSADPHYFESISLLVAIFAILSGFLVTRKVDDFRELVWRLNSFVPEKSQLAVIKLARMAEKGYEGRLVEEDGFDAKMNGQMDDISRREIAIHNRLDFSLTEVIVTILLALSIVLVGLFGRENGFASDMAFFVTAVSASFLTFFVVELSNRRYRWKMAVSTVRNAIDTSQDNRANIIFPLVAYVVIFIVFLILVLDKWIVDIITNHL